MMNVNIMKLIIDPIESRKETFAHKMARLWNYKEKTLALINASSNFAFEMKENKTERVLRLSHQTERSLGIIQAELDFILYLDSQKIPVAKPIPSNNGKTVEQLETEHGTFNGVVFEKIQGDYVGLEDMEEWQLKDWGKMMARMHNLSLKYKAHPERRRRFFNEDIDHWKKWIPASESRFIKKIDELKLWVNKLAENKNQFGLIHYDMSYDNFIWKGKEFSIIDFDDSAYYPFEADIAFALDDIRSMKNGVGERILGVFIEGYLSKRKLRDTWKQEIEQFLILEDFLKYARMRRAYDKVQTESLLPWSKKMSSKHMKWFEDVVIELDAYL